MLWSGVIRRLVADLHPGDNVQSRDGKWHTVTSILPFWNQRKFSVIELDNVIVRVYSHNTKVVVREFIPAG
jgi:hypothetical protein